MAKRMQTLQDAFDYFQVHSNLSPNTLATYGHAYQHFLGFLENGALASRLSLGGPNAGQRRLSQLGSDREDVNTLLWFVSYLGNEVTGAPGPHPAAQPSSLEPATVRLYGQAMLTWFRFLVDELLIPETFPATTAIRKAQRQLRTYVPASEARDGAPEPPRGMEELVTAYDQLEIDPEASPEEQRRQKLEGLRNRALLYALADSGARVSEVLRLTADDILGARLNDQGIWQIRVRGKGRGKSGRLVTLRFTAPTLEAMRQYLTLRNDPGAADLFVSHARTRPKYRGQPLSANAVWRMIRRTSKVLGLPHIHPHDFRHWRATQMLQEGVPIDQVQRFLNHRSIRTTQLYAKTAERQVDQAGVRTSPVSSRDQRDQN